MRSIVLAMVLATGLISSAAARDPLTGLVESFFNYEAPRPPTAGNCAAIATEIGTAATWYGEFSGSAGCTTTALPRSRLEAASTASSPAASGSSRR